MGGCCSSPEDDRPTRRPTTTSSARPHGSAQQRDYPMQPITKPAAAYSGKIVGGSYRLGSSDESPHPASQPQQQQQPDRTAVLAAAEKRARQAQARGASSSGGPGKLAKQLAQQQKMTTQELREQDAKNSRAMSDGMAWRMD
ncbi:hypothetical protein H4R33_005384 [Dimargaris cristalligena]|nr:hypothetical protein H4R33_005384 [Dimargaris cristalligena]